MSTTTSSSSGYAGQQRLSDTISFYNQQSFLVRQLLGLVGTITIAQVLAVSNSGTDIASGTVDVQPLINLIDNAGISSPRAVLAKIPYIRIQGGGNAVIIDPIVGDIGLVLVCDRDSSKVRTTKKQANPGSYRRFDPSDGIYLGGILNGVPNQFVRFFSGGIEIADANANTIEMNSTGITINGVLFDRSQNVSAAASLTTSGEVTSTLGGTHTLTQHKHGGVTAGGAQTATPTG